MNYLILLLLVIAVYAIYRYVTMRKREEEKQKIEFDAFIVQSAIKIVSAVKYLDEEKFNLVFEKGFVYYETPRKTRECLLTPIRTLNDEENKNFADLIFNSLSKENYMSVKIEDTEIAVSKMNKA